MESTMDDEGEGTPENADGGEQNGMAASGSSVTLPSSTGTERAGNSAGSAGSRQTNLSHWLL